MRRCKGFTLVEVLVALVVVAVGMGALLAALGAAADNTSYLRDKTFAQWVALNRVAEVRLQNGAPTKGKTNGTTEFAGHKWQWEQEVTSLDVPGVLRMDVKVRMADTTPAKNAPWIGNALGVIGDSILPAIASVSTQSTWEMDPNGPPGTGDPNDPNNPNRPPVVPPGTDDNGTVNPPPNPES
jgi:general secretion pathway protein I